MNILTRPDAPEIVAAQPQSEATPPLPGFQDWAWHTGAVADGVFTYDRQFGDLAATTIAVSAPFELEPGRLNAIEIVCDVTFAEALDGELHEDLGFEAGKQSTRRVARRQIAAGANRSLVITFVPKTRATYRIVLHLVRGNHRWPQPSQVTFRALIRHPPPALAPEVPTGPATGPAPNDDTTLPHWGPLERWIHARCKASRNFNGFVSAVETRIGREEVLSLPQYMSLCPTGQCNATCGFCSVTIGRTGIVKKQLPLDAIRRFTAPARNTVRLYGLEGNGEPTLYREFASLAQLTLSDGAIAYLITNASQFGPELMPVLLGLDSINISLNAASAETHRRVMGLDGFHDITANIRELMLRRGTAGQIPQVSISFVVTRDNVFEAVEFLQMGAFDLGVDRILLRPLSELGNDQGAVEDLRDLVPYHSEIDDLIEGVEDWLALTATTRRCEIVFDPETFRAVRPDPPGIGVLPLDRPDELPCPRRGHWQATGGEATTLTWTAANQVTAHRKAPRRGGSADAVLVSDAIPVPAGRTLTLPLRLTGEAPDLEVRVRDAAGTVIASERLAVTRADQSRAVRLAVPTGATSVVTIELAHGTEPFDIEADLGRVRRPALLADPHPPVPAAVRWEVATPEAHITWQGDRQQIAWDGAAGLYLAKSYSRPCLPGVTLRYPVRIAVTEGALGIGVLSQDFQSWVKTFRFDVGTHDTTLDIDVGTNNRVQIVVYAATAGRLAASIDWTRAMQPRAIPLDEHERLAAAARVLVPPPKPVTIDPVAAKMAHRQAMAAAKATVAKASANKTAAATAAPATTDAGASPAATRRGGSFWRLFHDPRTIHCHKPWTDLHNFTVDGRMDVCCIATGASQPRFALGNLGKQSFQQVWNGPVAREFRRTVNDPVTALPPCQRCPMARAYAGPLFSPEGTFFSVWSRVSQLPLARYRLGRYALFAAFLAIYGPVHLWVFRGYVRPSWFPSFDKLRDKR